MVKGFFYIFLLLPKAATILETPLHEKKVKGILEID